MSPEEQENMMIYQPIITNFNLKMEENVFFNKFIHRYLDYNFFLENSVVMINEFIK